MQPDQGLSWQQHHLRVYHCRLTWALVAPLSNSFQATTHDDDVEYHQRRLRWHRPLYYPSSVNRFICTTLVQHESVLLSSDPRTSQGARQHTIPLDFMSASIRTCRHFLGGSQTAQNS